MTKLVGRDDVVDLARCTLEEANGVLFVGPAGIGKSALSEQVGSTLAADQWHVEIIRCSEMTKALPFAPLMHILPPAGASDPSQLSQSLIDAVAKRAGNKRLLLVVDDLQHSDPGTATVIFGLLTHHDARVIAATRPADTNGPAVQTLWKDGHLRRVDVAPLDSRAVADLASTITGAPLGTKLRSELAQRADGNPFYASALVRVGVTSGAIQQVDGFSELCDVLPASTEINDVLRSQLAAISPGELALLETIAVGENMPVELFGDVDEQRSIERLVHAGLAVVDRSSPTHATRCAHPLIGEYLRRQLPPGRSRSIQQLLVDRVTELDVASSLDVVRAVAAGLDTDAKIPNPMLLEAAGIALTVFNIKLAQRTASRVCEHEPSGASHLLLGTAHAMSGAIDAANHHFARAEEHGLNQHQLAQLAVAQSKMVLFFDFDAARSAAILQAAFDSLTEVPPKAAVGAALLYPLFMTGQHRSAVKLCSELAQYPDLDPTTELSILGMWSVGRFLTASFDGLDDSLQRAEQLIQAGDGPMDKMTAIQLGLAETILSATSGHYEEAIALIRSKVDLYVLSSTSGGLNSTWSTLCSTTQALTGDIDDALQHSAVALEESRVEDPLGMAPMMVAASAAVLALSGDIAKGRALLDAAPADPFLLDPRSAIWKAWADVLLVADHDPAAAALIGAEAAHAAIEHGLNYWTWTVLTAVVHIGHAEVVVDILEREALASPVLHIQLMAQHARAATDHDANALTRLGDQFAGLGAWTCCAVAHRDAAALLTERGDPTAAGVANVKAALAFGKCHGLRLRSIGPIQNPLSDHETDVAQMAAAGQSSKMIADARYVSTRTVDNQLRSVYKKLGIAGRAELAAIFQ